MAIVQKGIVKFIEPAPTGGMDAVVETETRIIEVHITGPEFPMVGQELDVWIVSSGETKN